MDIHRTGHRPSTPGAPEHFTGTVRLDPRREVAESRFPKSVSTPPGKIERLVG